MSRFIKLTAVIIALVMSFQPIASAENPRKVYIVRLTSEPVYSVADGIISENREKDTGKRTAKIQAEQNFFTDSVKEKTNSRIKFSYDQVFNGMAIEATESEIRKIKELDCVTAVYESKRYHVDPAEFKVSGGEDTPAAYNSDIGADSGADALRAATEKLKPGTGNGEGSVIAVIDSELDVNHEAFQNVDDGKIKLKKYDIRLLIDNAQLSAKNLKANKVYKNNKIPFAYDYCAKNESVSGNENTPIHGTHVTGIAAGNSERLKGMAPQAQIIFMKVADEDGSLPDYALIAAINDAVKLGVDVINFSIGEAYANCTESDPIIEATKNVSVSNSEFIASAGNSGIGVDTEYGTFCDEVSYSPGGNPSGSRYTVSVGNAYGSSSEKTYRKMKIFNEKGRETGSVKFRDAADESFDGIFSDKKYEVVMGGSATESELDAISGGIKGKIVIVSIGGIYDDEKCRNISSRGGAGMIICSESIDDGTNGDVNIPTAVVDYEGESALYEASYIMTLNEEYATKEDKKMNESSSYSINEFLNGGVQISAAGTNVLSSYPEDKYVKFTGTSMAAPTVSGAYVLVKNYLKVKYPYLDTQNPEFTTICLNMLENTADIIESPEQTDYDGSIIAKKCAYSLRCQGAGYINLKSLVSSDVMITHKGSSLEGESIGKAMAYLGYTENRYFDFTLQLRNFSEKDVKYNKISGISLRNSDKWGQIEYISEDAGATFEMPSSITVPAMKTVDFKVKVSLDDSKYEELTGIFKNGFFLDGFITFANTSRGVQKLSVPFTGFMGDFTKAPIFGEANKENYSSNGYMYLCYYNGMKEENKEIKFISDAAERRAVSAERGNTAIAEGYEPSLSFRQLRGTSKNILTISDEYGDAVYKRTYYGWGNDKQILSLVNAVKGLEGKYTLNMEGFLNTDSKTTDNVNFDFYVDNTPPVIDKITIDSTTSMTVTARDNIAPYSVVVTDTDGKKADSVFYYDTKNKVYKAVVPKWNLNNNNDYTVEVYDAERNMTSNKEDKKVILTVTDEGGYADGNKFIDTLKIKNETGDAVKGIPVIQFCTSKGNVFSAAVVKEFNIAGGAEKSVDINLNIKDESKYKRYKIFIWSSLSEIKPLEFRIVRN